MFRSSRWFLLFLIVLGVGAGVPAAGQSEKSTGRLTLVESVPLDKLDAVVSVTISNDGKFLYAASWRAATLTCFARDPETGKLQHRQTVDSDDVLAGTTSIALSPDGRHAIATAFQSRTAVLYRRSAETGELTQAAVARDGEGDVHLQWPIRAHFAPDGKFAYVIDDVGPGEGAKGAVAVFRVHDGELERVAIDEGNDGCYAGARGLAIHPDGRTLFAACHRPGTLVVADRDLAKGVTSVRQVLANGFDNVGALAGAMGVAVSPDGRDIYVSSGRFDGDNAVSAFRLQSDGRLTRLQEFVNDAGDLRDFAGGNHLALSPDGRNVYATATVSGTVAAFRRDPVTGKLSYLETVPDGGPGGGLGAAGVGISPDGRFVYVATEDKRAISVFRRDTGQ
jgi:6-phosphogluconolactonase (cycloisomerase 2 family)